MNKNKSIGIGVIGVGKWGKVLAHAAIKSGHVHIVGGYARTDSSREDFSKTFNCKNFKSIEHMLTDSSVDAVIIASANSAHKEHALLAAKAGKHIHLEKPMALSITDAKEIIQTCKNEKVKLQIGQCYRRMPMFRLAKKIISENKLGLISLATFHYSDKLGLIGESGNTRWDPAENPGGPLFSYLIHMADVMEYLFGEIVAVNGYCGKVGGPAMTEDCAGGLLQFKNGQLGILSGSYISSFRVAVSIEGTDAVLHLSNKQLPLLQPIEGYAGMSPVISSEAIDLEKNYLESREFAIQEQFIDFVKAIHQDQKPEVDGIAGLRALAIMRALLKSHEEKRLIITEEIIKTD